MSKAFFIFGLLIWRSTSGQNLVANPGFEEFTMGPPPTGFSTNIKDFKLPGWNSPNLGTPDYFRGYGNGGVPNNWAGTSSAHGGKSYAGIISGSCSERTQSKNSYREYLQGILTEPLKAGDEYFLEFYFKLASNAGVSIDRIGLILLDTLVFYNNDYTINIPPTLDFQRPELKAGSWEHASISYKAHGGERYLVIGNFYPDIETKCRRLEFRTGRSDMISGSTYYYIDDVSITPIKPFALPLISKGPDGGELKLFQRYGLKRIKFEFDSYDLRTSILSELDTLALIMAQRPAWKIEVIGYCDDRGSEEYNKNLSIKRAQSVSNYLQLKGVDVNRIINLGKGKATPTNLISDENYRAKNRRVEIKFLTKEL